MTPLPRLYASATALVESTPSLREFSPWPDNPPAAHRIPVRVPAVSIIENLAEPVGGRSSRSEIGRTDLEHTNTPDDAHTAKPTLPQSHIDLMSAVSAAANDLEWRRTYTEDEVGADFMQRYGYVELLGPTGHFIDHTTRAYIGYWGPGLQYPWHAHQPEELYFVLTGAAEFTVADGRHHRAVGDTQLHTSNQPHAMSTEVGSEGLLTFVLWRGEGLDGLPTMTPGAT